MYFPASVVSCYDTPGGRRDAEAVPAAPFEGVGAAGTALTATRMAPASVYV